MRVDELTKELVRFSRLSYRRRLVGATGGNLSVRVGENIFLITPSGISLRDVSSKDLITIDQEGRKLDGSEALRPSKEGTMHLRVYKKLPEINAVIHLHPLYTTSFSVKEIPLSMVTVSSKLKLREVPLVRPALPGSIELANSIEKVLQRSDSQVGSIMLGGHGLLSFGASLAEAYDTAELVEETAKVNFISQNISKRIKNADL